MTAKSPYYSHTSFRLASQLSCAARSKIYERFVELMNPTEFDKVLDIGVTSDGSRPESNFFERAYNWRNNLTCVGTEDARHLESVYPGLRFIKLCPSGILPFHSGQFDIVFSNATIEHAGDFGDQVHFMREAMRVGKRFFIVTPNRWFPVDFHTCLPFLHWLPRPLHRFLLRIAGMEFWSEESNLRLLSREDLLDCVPWPKSHLAKTSHVGFAFSPTNIIIYGDTR